MAHFDLAEDGGCVSSHVEDNLVVGADVVGLVVAAAVGGDELVEAKTSEVALEGETPVLELVLVTREDWDRSAGVAPLDSGVHLLGRDG